MTFILGFSIRIESYMRRVDIYIYSWSISVLRFTTHSLYLHRVLYDVYTGFLYTYRVLHEESGKTSGGTPGFSQEDCAQRQCGESSWGKVYDFQSRARGFLV